MMDHIKDGGAVPRASAAAKMGGFMTQVTSSDNFLAVRKAARSILLGSAACVALSGVAAPAMAQEAAEEEDAGAIIVIARSRAESLQETPVNITSLGAETIDSYQVNEIADVVNRVPGLNVQVGGSGAGAQISLRGLGSSNISSAFDSAVGLDFDGVQVSTQRLLQTGFFDVQQIDVLKGPQSLYFGKSASAGVLSLKSANPTSDWEIAAKGSYEFEEDGYTIGGYISGPISETLGIRVAAQYQDLNKYVQIEPQVAVRDRNKGLTNLIGRLTLQWDPVDNFTANLKINYNKQDSETILGHSDLGCGPDGLISPTRLLGAVVFQSSHSCDINDGRYPDSDGDPRLNRVFAGTTGDGRDLSQPYNETDIFYARLAMDLNLSDTLKLSTVSGYVDLFNEYNGNFNYTGNCPVANFNPVTGCSGGAIAGGFMAPFRNELIQFTQEARLTSDFDGPFNFMLGAFWEDRKMPYGTSQNAFVAAFIAPTSGGETFDWYAERDSKAQALSFFGSATWDITDQLELSGGVRWTDEKKSTTISFPYVHDVITFGFGFLPSGFFAGPVRFSDSNWSPELSLKYQAAEDINVYAAYKTGFKSGGIDNNALPSGPLRNLNSPDPAVRAAIEDGLRFESETSQGGEIGIRSQFADRSVTLNATAFYYVFKDLQIQEFSLAIFNFETYNASKVKTKGLDIDWAWRTPLEGLRLFGAMSYTDTKYAEDIVRPNLSVALVNGRSVARAPKFSGNIAFDWRSPVGDALEIGLSGNATYSDSYWTNPVDTDYRQPSYVTFDATISVGDPDGKWKLSLIGTNLTDEIWTNTNGAAPFSADDKVHTQNRGRQLFVEGSVKF
jgi:iron complex outermembrane recepter protein